MSNDYARDSEGPDQMRRLIWAFTVQICPNKGFCMARPTYNIHFLSQLQEYFLLFESKLDPIHFSKLTARFWIQMIMIIPFPLHNGDYAYKLNCKCTSPESLKTKSHVPNLLFKNTCIRNCVKVRCFKRHPLPVWPKRYEINKPYIIDLKCISFVSNSITVSEKNISFMFL